MAVKGKIEDKVEIKTSAQEFHDVLNGKPHHVANITPDKVHGCTLHSGDLGSTGSTIEWHYTHEGVKKSTKQIIEVDDGKYKVVYKIIGGHFSEEYNNFHIIYDAIPKPEDGDHTIVHWIFEYEKHDENTPDPNSLLEYLCGVTKDIDAHIQEESSCSSSSINRMKPIKVYLSFQEGDDAFVTVLNNDASWYFVFVSVCLAVPTSFI